MQKTHFIFDLDDTLTDSYDFNQQMFVNVFGPHINLKDPEVDKYLRSLHYNSRGTSMLLQFKEAINHFSLAIDPKSLIIDNEELQLKGVSNMKMFDAVIDIIKALHEKGKKISICSNRGKPSLDSILDKHQIKQFLFNAISCAEAKHEKPDPFCLNEIIKKSGEPKENFIYFGDSKTDSQFASNAGVDFVIIDHYLNQKKFYKMIIQSFM